MAGLGNTGIKGFLASAKFTGQKIIKRGKEIPEMVEHFLSGFAGYGWKIWEHKRGKYKLEIDDLNVRGTMTVYELLIQKIRAVIGALAITQGQGKIKSVALSPDQSEYLIQVEEDMSFREYDFIRCQTWTGNVKMYHVKIGRISDNTIIHIPIEEFDTDYDEFGQLVIHNAPAIGDDIIQFGNEVYEDRQSAIYLHVDESGQPAIDIMFGINSKDWTNCVKGRLGGDIPGGDGAKGMYFENGMIKGTDETGHTVYCIYPNGDAMFGGGSAMFNSDRSGKLAGGAIQWHFNDDKGRFELILGEDVIMSWDNLDNTTKEMLTPKIGENGNWWIGGKDTGQKAEGEDGNSPYIGENGNWWLGTTDTGVQAKANDGKSPYIGTNGNWFIWDATQNKFVDSGDTSVGDDGKSPEIRDGYWWTWDGTEYVNTGVKAKGEDANLLPWIEEWDSNKTMIGTEQVVAPKMFSGTRDANGKLTGVALGRDCITIDGVKHTGIFALNEDELMVELDPINKKYKFTGEVQATSGALDSITVTNADIENVTISNADIKYATIDGLLKVSSGYEGNIGDFNLFWIAPTVAVKTYAMLTTFNSKGKIIKFFNASVTKTHTINLPVVGFVGDPEFEDNTMVDNTINDETKGAVPYGVRLPPSTCVEVSCFEIPPGVYITSSGGKTFTRVLSWEMTNRFVHPSSSEGESDS